MILGRQHADRAGGLGHPIGLDKLAPNILMHCAQQLKRHRRRAVEDIFKAAIIDVPAARVHREHLQRRRNHEKARHAMPSTRSNTPSGSNSANITTGQSRRERHDPKTGAADMRAWHRDQHRLVIIPLGLRLSTSFECLRRREQIPVR